MSLLSKVTTFARSPQGKQAMNKAKRYASDPATKQKIEQARRRFASKRG